MLEQLGLQQVTIPLPFRLDHVNCFLAEGEDGWMVVDTGLNRDVTRNMWADYITDRDISTIVITHHHPDHYGYAGALQNETGAHVIMTKTAEEAGIEIWRDDFINRVYQHYLDAGIPGDLAGAIADNTRSSIDHVLPHPRVDSYLQEGETIQIGRLEYEIISTPGHAPGMVCFYNRPHNVLLSTDHVLPKITPNISYWFDGDQNPLQTYFNSLDKIKKLDADLVIPSHGKPFHGANERIDGIMRHHDKRFNQIIDVLKHQPMSVYALCLQLFGDNLTVHESRFAIGETLAHLEYLRRSGECERDMDESGWYYRL